MIATLFALAAVAPQPLQPAGKWTVSYNAGDCTLQRSFGDAARPTVFGFNSEPTNVSGELVLLFPTPGAGKVKRGKERVTLGPGGEQFAAKWASGPLSAGRHGVRFSVEKPFWDAFAKRSPSRSTSVSRSRLSRRWARPRRRWRP